MPTCNFFSTTNHYQSHIQSFGKVLKVFLEFSCDSADFISIIFQGGGNFGLLGFHRIFIGVALCKNWQWLPNQNKNGDNTASTLIRRKQNKV